jgi:antitoxin component YwqK of YwqJK toxin-antitoxin module
MIGLLSCKERRREYFFLEEYPELVLRDKSGAPFSQRQYIDNVNQNGIMTYVVKDSAAMLFERKSGNPYSGFIRTFHWGIYNVEAVYEDGYIQRLRYWHPNRVLAQDMDYANGTGYAWNAFGELSIVWEPDETQYRNPLKRTIRRLITDSVTYHYDFNGDLYYYTKSNDSLFMQYYPDGTPRFQIPVGENGMRDGEVKRWHPNGTLRALGYYKDGKEDGIWFEYDSLGNPIDTVDFTGEEPTYSFDVDIRY